MATGRTFESGEMVYDAAIIGAGADGLAAAAILARAGLKTIVLERNAEPGGRLATREFHPGFRAGLYVDELAPIPRPIFAALDLARRGAIFAPSLPSLAVWPDRAAASSDDGARLLSAEARARAAALLVRAAESVGSRPRLALLGPREQQAAWPSEDWADMALADLLASAPSGRADGARLAADALSGRAADPFLRGSALHLLVPGRGASGLPRGGPGALAAALRSAATEAGTALSFNLEVADIRHGNGRVRGVMLADGSEIAADAVISTLDLKRTFLSLFPWSALPRPLANRVNGFRMAGSTARLLLALERPLQSPKLDGAEPAAPIHIGPDIALLAAAQRSWRAGALAEALPLTLRVPSAFDPTLAPFGAATATVTIGCVPAKLFDGAWSHEKRDLLRDRVLAALEAVFPSLSNSVLASELVVPSDIEEGLALTEGDLSGGEIAPDQMLGARPWSEYPPPRTPFRSLYLAGPSTLTGLLATCASGVAAAEAVLADRKTGLFT